MQFKEILFSDYVRVFLRSFFLHWKYPTVIMVFHDGDSMGLSHCEFFSFHVHCPMLGQYFFFFQSYFNMFLSVSVREY